MVTDDQLVSVVLPVYNGGRFLERTIASALAQTYNPIEVIVVDDGSSDQSPEIARSAAARDPRVRYFRIENSGAAAARNFGISQARGDFIAMLDHDDLWHREKIARQLKVMRSSPPEVGVVYCLTLEIDEQDFIIPHKLQKKRVAQGRVTEDLALGCFIESSSAALMKRCYFEAVGGYDPSLRPQGAEDWKLYLALSEVCEFAVIPEFLVGYRQPTESLSRNIIGMGESIDIVGRWIFEKRPDLPQKSRRLMVYYASVYLAQRSLDNDQFGLALRYSARAYRAYPMGLLRRPIADFVVRFLARLTGIKRSSLRRHGVVARVNFNDFVPPQKNRIECMTRGAGAREDGTSIQNKVKACRK
jgi:glycosyltransferase involved in cell wall biosynthesis